MVRKLAITGSKRTEESSLKKMAFFLRDGLACVFCGSEMENGAKLTVSEVEKDYGFATNFEGTNRVTCCERCEGMRGDRGLRVFCKAVASYLGDRSGAEILRHVRNQARKRPKGKEAIALKEFRPYRTGLEKPKK